MAKLVNNVEFEDTGDLLPLSCCRISVKKARMGQSQRIPNSELSFLASHGSSFSNDVSFQKGQEKRT